jgi:hypothetical protein
LGNHAGSGQRTVPKKQRRQQQQHHISHSRGSLFKDDCGRRAAAGSDHTHNRAGQQQAGREAACQRFMMGRALAGLAGVAAIRACMLLPASCSLEHIRSTPLLPLLPACLAWLCAVHQAALTTVLPVRCRCAGRRSLPLAPCRARGTWPLGRR